MSRGAATVGGGVRHSAEVRSGTRGAWRGGGLRRLRVRLGCVDRRTSRCSVLPSNTSWTDLPVTASKSNAARPVSSWAAWACIPVCLMTVVPYWMFFVLESPSVSSTYEQRMSHVRDAMGYAGVAVVLALAAWRWAATGCRLILGVCVATNLYTLFVASGQALHAAVGRW